MKSLSAISATIILSLLSLSVFAARLPTEERRPIVDEYDTHGLRHGTGVVTDSDAALLAVPDDYPGTHDFTVAETPPTIDFAPIRGLEPEFFPDDNRGMWSQWGEVTKGDNGRFYMASGDHRCKDAKIYITEYDPVTKTQRNVVDIAEVCGWQPGEYVDGKIHGRMDIMPDGTLIAATWLGRDVTDDDLAHGYVPGGHLVTYNIHTEKAKYHGVPFYGDSWPYHSIDTNTGVIMAVGHELTFMAYDVFNDSLIYGGYPPPNMKWNERAMLLDETTGKVYGTDTELVHKTQGDDYIHHFIEYDQFTNKFRLLDCAVPTNPVTGKNANLRAYTTQRTSGDFFWCFDYQGTMFKFFPDEESTELVGVNWDESGAYIASMAISPGEKYLYYVPGASSGSWKQWRMPVVQYNTETGEKKVLAWLHDYYHEKYGYKAGGTFGIELSEDGSLLVIQTNGNFGPYDSSALDYPAIFAVHIPESERRE